MIPDLIDIKSDWEVLPSGIHNATMNDIEARYTWTETRVKLFNGLKLALASFRHAGCKTVYLDGSFVTSKDIPGDYDVCWDPLGVDPSKLDPVFLDFSDKRKNQKLKFKGEFFPASIQADRKGTTFLDFFQIDKNSGNAKGILKIQL